MELIADEEKGWGGTKMKQGGGGGGGPHISCTGKSNPVAFFSAPDDSMHGRRRA